MMMYELKKIEFDEIISIWQDELWPNRISAIETHSTMVYPNNPKEKFNMDIFDFPVIFYGVYHKKQIVGVNSGHLSGALEYRSRGLWVKFSHRRNGIAKLLLNSVIDDAKQHNAVVVWSIPRVSAKPVYESVGFITMGIPFDQDMEFGPNVYVTKLI